MCDINNDLYCEHAFYDFGTVSTGTQAFKIISVKNERTIPQHFEITRDPDTNPLDQSFNVEPYTSPEIQPYGVFTFKIEYSPVVPFTISYDYFNIFDGFGLCCQFGVKGKSLGPLVEVSSHNLVLALLGMTDFSEETIELTNDSADYARFQFDFQDDSHFQVQPLQGIIAPKSRVHVTIGFGTDEPGIYVRHLFCLVLFQSPLMIEVIGVKSFNEKLKVENIALSRYLQGDMLNGGFDGYMSDSKRLVETPPPVSLSTNCVDFGPTEVGLVSNKTEIICMTNHIIKDITVAWITDGSKLFNIEPSNVRIPSNETAIFEVFFHPDQYDRFYDKHFIASITWDQKSTQDSLSMDYNVTIMSVPISLTLRAIGHTYSERSSCLPLYQILPATIRMPPCVPPMCVYNTFCIERLGKDPMMFKFIPPKVSNYAVKPMNGLICGDFQVIVVGVVPESKDEAPYFERWTLQFNGSPHHEITIDFCAYAEYPKIEVGEENTVVFPPTFPGTEQNGEVCLKNFTRHYIWYHFSVSDADSSLRLLEGEGAIASNEILYNTWQFAPKQQGVHTIKVNCDTCALLDCWCPLGTFVSSEITVFAESEYTELVSLPGEFIQGIISYKSSSKLSFHLFNFGRCKIYFNLKSVPADDLALFVEKDVDIYPNSGKIEAFGKMEIFVSIHPSSLGEHMFSVAYEVRPNSKSSLNVLPEPKVLNLVRYECVLPVFEIIDMNYLGGSPTISKLWLWRMMKINRMNEKLRTLTKGTKTSIEVDLPHSMIGSHPLTIFLLIKNTCDVPAPWKMKYHEACNCVVRTDYLSRREFTKECNHRNQITVYPSSGKFMPRQEQVLMIVLRYIVEGRNQVRYHLELDSDREITIFFNSYTFEAGYCAPSVYSSTLTFQTAYVGDRYPCVEAYWLYNNVSKPTFYNVDIDELRNYNLINMYDVIKCINPSGTIQPKTAHPILFRFSPKAFDFYDVDVHVWLGSENSYRLQLKGDGVESYEKLDLQMSHKAPNISLFDMKEIPVYLSSDHLLIGPFLTYSQDERIFFIDNRSPNIVIGFKWHKYELAGVLTCSVQPECGILSPGETQVCKLNIRSYAQPCLITVHILCEITNLTLQEMYEKAEALRREMLLKHKDIFTITEKGIRNPDCPLDPIDAPQSLYRVIAVTCSIISSITVDEKLSVREQLKLFPFADEFAKANPPKKRSGLVSRDEHTVKMIRHIIENIIWELIFSKRFGHALENIRNEGSPLYGQFIMEPKEERKLLNLHRYIPSRNVIARIIRRIIMEIFHEEYNLGAWPFTRHGDSKEKMPNVFLTDDHNNL